MNLRAIHFRAILLPISVAALLIAGILWYRLFWIPGQQQYLNERNSRILQTIAMQIATKVNLFDQAIDHAIEEYWPDDKQAPTTLSEADKQKFKDYVASFTNGELEVTSGNIRPQPGEKLPKGTERFVTFPGDPPRVAVIRDEGTNYLFLGYSHKETEPEIEVKSDIQRIVRPFLEARGEFEALLLVDLKGRVIAQYSAKGLKLESVNGLDFSVTAQTTPQTAKPTFDVVRNSGKVASVAIGDAGYKFYSQPVVLSLMVDQEKLTQPEEWTLCGLVRSDRFGAASMAISPNYWLLFVLALLAICLGVPILKVHVLKPRERFHRSDGAWVAATTFLLAGLIAMAAFDGYYFGYLFKTKNEEQLRLVSDKIGSNLEAETMAMRAQIDSFASQIDKDNLPDKKDSTVEFAPTSTSDKLLCSPIALCRSNQLTDEVLTQYSYPYFDLVSWTDQEGDQRLKLSTLKGLTPFINLRESNVSYFDAIESANRLNSGKLNSGSSEPIDVGIAVLPSPNTGNNITVVWKALGNYKLSGLSLTLKAPISVSRPVLPRSVQFAVIDTNGLVIYHSDPTRSLNENFFQETENNSRLRAAIQGRDNLPLTTQYLGLRQRLVVRPLELAGPGKLTRNPGWTLVVFQPVDVPDTVNLEALLVTGTMFVLYFLTIGSIWMLAAYIAPARTRKWFWPDRTKAVLYRNVALLNLGISLVFLAFVTHGSPTGIVMGGILLGLVGLAASFTIVTHPSKLIRPDHPEWQRDFFAARLSFLFVTAAIPAMAFFQAFFALETDVLLRKGELQAASQASSRMERIQKDALRLKLCKDGDDPCAETEKYLQMRNHMPNGDHYDTGVAPLFFESTLTTLPGSKTNPWLEAGWLDRFVAAMYFPFNDAADDLRSALLGLGPLEWSRELNKKDRVSHALIAGVEAPLLPGTSSIQKILEDATYCIVGLVVAIGLGLLLQFGIMPMYLSNLCFRPDRKLVRAARTDGNLVIVGPPGTEKTALLKSNPLIHVFDARIDRFGPVEATAHNVVGVDHFEYALEQEALRESMLAILESLTYSQRQVWIATTREPLDHLRELSAGNMDRWIAVFQSYRKETVGLATYESSKKVLTPIRENQSAATSPFIDLVLKECSMSPQLLTIGEEVLKESLSNTAITEEELLTNIGVAAEPYYRALWTTCSSDEKLTLRQLAAETVVNPRNGPVIARLMQSRLIRRDPTFRVMNETFRRFTLQILTADELIKEEHKGLTMPWSSYAVSFATLAAALTAVVFLTQQQLLDTWVGYVPMIVPVVTTAGKLIAGGQRPGKPSIGSA